MLNVLVLFANILGSIVLAFTYLILQYVPCQIDKLINIKIKDKENGKCISKGRIEWKEKMKEVEISCIYILSN